FADGVYQVGASGSFTLISATRTDRLAVDGAGNLIGLRDSSDTAATTGTAHVVKIVPSTGATTSLADLSYTRAAGDAGPELRDIAAAPDGTVYIAVDPDGSGGGAKADGV